MKMRKTLLPILAVLSVLLICVLVLPGQAQAATSGYYTYTVSGGKATITDCDTSVSGDITIPSTLGGYPVTTIGDDAFFGCTSLTSLDIPDCVTTIGKYAFHWCTDLTKVIYCGMEQQWNQISIGSSNTYLTDAARQYHDYQAATCATPKTCAACGQTEGNALGHSYSSVTTAPTCTEQGYTTHTCTTCGDTYADAYVAATGHNWSAWIPVTSASCTAEGSQLRFCNCGAQETESIGKLPHNYVNGTCSACGHKALGSLSGMTMSLGNSLAANFVVMKTYAKGEGNYAIIEKAYADGTTKSVTIPQSEWQAYGTNGYYIAFAGVTAKEMTDQFTVNIYNVNGEQVIATYVRSIEGYCYDQIVKEEAKAAPDAEKLALYVDILKYGAAAQVYFENYNIENMAIARMSGAAEVYPAILKLATSAYNSFH